MAFRCLKYNQAVSFSLKFQMLIVILLFFLSGSKGIPLSNKTPMEISESHLLDLNLNTDGSFVKKISKRDSEWSNREVNQPVLPLKQDNQKDENIEKTTRFPRVVRVRLQNGTRARQLRHMNQQNVEKENTENNSTFDGAKGKIVRIKKFKRKKPTEKVTTTMSTPVTTHKSPTPRYTRPTVKTTRRATTRTSAYSHITVINKIEKDQKPKRKQKNKNLSLWIPTAEFGGRASPENDNKESTPPSVHKASVSESKHIQYENPTSYDKEYRQRGDHNQEQRSAEPYQEQNYKRMSNQHEKSKFGKVQYIETSTVQNYIQGDLQRDQSPKQEISPYTIQKNRKQSDLEAKSEEHELNTPELDTLSKHNITPTSSPKILDHSKSFEVLNDDNNYKTPQNGSLQSTNIPLFDEYGNPYFGQTRPDFGGYNNQFSYNGDPSYFGPRFDNREPFFQTNREYSPMPHYNPFYNRNPQRIPNYYSGPQQFPMYQRPDSLGLSHFEPSPHILSLRRSILEDEESEESIDTTTEFTLPKFEMPPIDFNDKGCRTVYKEVRAVPEFPDNIPTYEKKAKSVVLTRECFFPDGVPTVSPTESKTEISVSTSVKEN